MSTAKHKIQFDHHTNHAFLFLPLPATTWKIKGERGKAWKGEDPQENWEKGQVLWICRGVGVVPSRVIRDEYRI